MTATEAASRVAVDIGGTFTDTAAVAADGRLLIGKTLTTPGRAVDGVLASIDSSHARLDSADLFIHGTTMVINALLERRGSRTAIVTTRGFADVLALGRGNRPEIFNPFYRRNPPFVPREYCFELDERMNARGEPLRVPAAAEIAALIERLREVGIESVAVAFLHAYRNPEHERLVATAVREALPNLFVTASSEVGKQRREYERFTTASANAYVGPFVKRYAGLLESSLRDRGFAGDALFLDAGGGAVGRDTAETFPIRLVESGPVGGVIASAALAKLLDRPNVVTLDIGGTTAKSALIQDFRFETLEEYWIGGYERGLPIQVPVVDIHEVGAGGGSIAYREYGRLRVGPRSAGADPGPACYGNGGTEPTVTDALVHCGRLNPDCFIAELTLQPERSRSAIHTLATDTGIEDDRLALGILELANASVASAVRTQTLERGRDPAAYLMIVSGGAGPALACDVAEVVGISEVLIPRSPGHFSAIGMLQADLRFSTRIVVDRDLASVTAEELAALRDEQAAGLDQRIAVRTPLAGERRVEVSLALRFAGQDHALRMPVGDGLLAGSDFAAAVAARFRESYAERYGYVDDASPIEVVDMETVVARDLPQWSVRAGSGEERVPAVVQVLFREADGFVDTVTRARASLAAGERLTGPALVYEPGSITVVNPGWSVATIADGNLLLTRIEGSR